ncbi:MAG: signal recognition particle protein [Bacteroidetes bacterium]|nr:signal recognition particle protein [Bacteroidota bacterium]MCH8523231.1 signal recognition particle protein [Balneolales bacterium]
MFDDLSGKLGSVFKSLSGQSTITEVNIAETIREIRRALLDADVNYEVAREFTRKVKVEADGQGVLTSVSPGQQFTKIVYDELVFTLGGTKDELRMANVPPTVILIAGLQGSGKTTFAGKLAKFLKDKKHTPMLAAADVYRPAAIEQLKTLASQIDVPVYAIEEKDALRVAKEALNAARKQACDVLIVDTAGRLHVDSDMMDEVAAIKEAIKPNETLFVVDSMTGQDAVNTAREFNTRIDFDGVVLTKLDGDTRGGAALSIKQVVEKPIKFVSMGEKLDALQEFYPDRMAQRILGMGDVVSLVEKAQQQFDEVEAKKLQSKIRSDSFNLEDFMAQMQQIKKMGSMQDLVSMIPGASNALKNVEVSDDALKPIEAIINSMTVEERRNPAILNGSRRRRIAKGAGTEVRNVNDLMRQFEQMKKMMKQMSNMGGMGRAMQSLKNLKPGRMR